MVSSNKRPHDLAMERDGSPEDVDMDAWPVTKKHRPSIEDFVVPHSPDYQSSNSNHSISSSSGYSPPHLHRNSFGTVPSPVLQEVITEEEGYDPELDEKSNPFYFSTNKMLYQAHLERMQREQREKEQRTAWSPFR